MKTKKILFGSTLLAAAALNFCATSATFAADVTWTGTSGTETSTGETVYDWSNSGNWDSGSATWTGNDNTTFTNDATNKTVTVDGTYIANSLTISGGSYTFKYTAGASLTVGSADGGSNLIIDGVEGTSLTVSGGTNAFNKLYVGRYSYGELTIKDGTNTFGGSTSPINTNVYIGAEEGGTGTMTIEGGTNDFMGAVYVGNRGTGTLTIEDGTNTFHDDSSYGWALVVGSSEGTTGTMTISGGKNTFNVSVDVGYSGTGTMTISGGENTFNKSLVISRGENSSGTFTITSGTNTFCEDIYVACGNPDLDSSGGTGTMTIEGGTNTFKDIVWIGNNGIGTFELKGGINAFGSDLRIGDYNQSGVSKMTISGGTNTFEAGTIYIGYDGTVTRSGTLEITGGTNTFGSDTANITISVGGSEAVGTFTISGGTTTINGSVTIAASSSATLTGGTISLSEAIQNSGSVTVSENVAFVVNDSLLDEGKNFTYTFITNTEADETTQTPAGTIVGWGSLTAENFVIDENLYTLADDIGVVLKADGQATIVFITEGENGTAITDYDFYIEAQSETTTTGNTLSGYTQFTGIGTLINGTVDGFVLQDRTSITGEPSAISGKNVYFAGVSEDGSDQLTITEINIATSTRTSNWYGGYEAFIVENATVILDGGVTGDNTKSSINTGNLDLTLCVGTMSDATLEITNGASITFVGVWSTVGSNGATGTINISGSGSELNTQQINIGMSVFSLSGGASTTNGYYFAQYLESDDERNAVIQAILNGSASGEGYEGSYGIVNVTDGGTWTVGVGNTNSSNSRIQLANGEINISGSGSQLLLGGASSLLMMGESSIVGVTWDETEKKYVYDTEVATGVMLTEKITVTDGGKVACADDANLYEMVVGDSWFASNGEASISVSGSDNEGNASTFDLSFSKSAWIGTNAGYWNAVGAQTPDGGTQNVTISASDGGIFKISAAEGVVVAADNYYDYFASGVTAGHSYGLHVDITAESGGSITLDGQNDVVILGAGSPATADVDEDGVNDYTNNVNVTADGSVTGDDGTVTASSVTLSAGNIYANWHNDDNVYVTLKATNGGAMTISATQGTTLNKNTTIVVDADSTLNTNGTVSFNAGSSLTVNAGGSWTSSGSVTVAAGASMDLNGTIDLSEAIQNSGSVTVNSDVVFVLKDSLLAEGSQYTYTLVVNELITDEETGETGSGTIVDWSTLTKDNFVYADGDALGDNIDVSVDVDGYVTLLYKEGGVTIDYEYKTPWQRGTHGLSGYIAAGEDLYYFEAIKFDVSGVNATDFTLQDANETAITNKNVYIVGDGKDSSTLTITDIKVSNTSAGYYAFIVENATVVINGTGVKVDELGMSLCIGTMDSAELQITGGAQVSTSGVWSTIGSNMATGTLTISGEGSSLTNAQINIGMAVTSLSGMSDTDAAAGVDGYYYANYIETDDEYYTIIAARTAAGYTPTDGSYGIVNVNKGGTWTISGNDTSNSRLQFSNGEINIDGEGSSLIFGKNSSLVMENMTLSLTDAEGNSVTLTVSETLNVTNGGSVKNADDVTLNSLTIGAIYDKSKGEATISVDGEGSSFDLSVGSSNTARIGYKQDSIEGGTEDVKISATNGGEFKISAANGIRMGWTYTSAEQADSINVSFSAESGGLISLVATSNALYFGQNTATTEAKSSVKVKASGEGSDVEIISESGAIWTNYNTSNFDASFVAENGGTMTVSASSDIVFGYGSSTAGSATVTADGGTVTMSGYDIVTNNNKSGDLSVTFTATNGGTMSLTATSSDNGAEGIHLNSNSSIIVEKGSTLTTSSAKTVLFENGSSISVDATSTWTDYGSVTVAEGASMNLNGTIDLSNQIQNSGEITVGDSVVFVLRENDKNFKDEDEHFNFTYDFIINTPADGTAQTTGGSIEGWDNLTIDNFSIVASDENNEVPENLGIVTKADGQATVVFVTESENGTATVDYDYYIDYQRSWEGRFYCIGITVDGTVDNFTLQDRTSITGNLDEITKDITGKDVLFIGSGATDADGKLVDSVTITEAKIANTGSSTNAFAVEGTKVIIDGQASDNDGNSQIVIDELGMNIVVGTMYGAGDAELVITNGASVTTSAYYNTVGSNLNTGTITITGEGSLLANQQITLGGGVNSLFAATAVSGQYQTKYFVDTDTYNGIRDTIVSSEFDPTSGSYGIVNVTDGGTWQVGVGNTNSSNNRIQLANGEINIDGGSLIFGKNSSLLMMNESLFSNSSTGGVYTGMNISEKVTVTNGGTVSVEEGGTMAQLVIGDTYVASNVTAAVSVDGSDDSGNASSFIISASTAVYIGTNSGYWTNTGTSTAKYEGGSADVTVSATDGGVIDLSSAGGMVICADNYATYIGATADGKIYSEAGHSYGLKVAITAESGGSLTLAATDGSTVLLAAGSPTEGYENTLTIKADGTSEEGTASSVTISGGDIYTNFGDKGESAAAVSVEITATNGGTIALKAAKVEDTGNGVISFGLNTAVTVEENSSLTTEGTSISFESGSSISVEKGSTWTDTGSVIVATGATMSLAGTETISDTLDSQGAITVSDGTLSATSISVAQAADSNDGSFTISGGTVSVETLTIGAKGLAGSFSMTGGTLNVSADGTFSIASTASASFSGGTVNVSTAIANDGAVTVSDSIVFVLNDSLKVEGTSATYAIIINGEGGTIEGWGDLGTSNFAYSNSALDTNVVLDLTTDGYVKLLYTNDGVTIDYDYEVPWQRGEHGLSGYEAAEKALYYFRAMHIEIEEGASVGGFTLQDLTNEEGDYAITSKNVYITGSGKDSSKLTITNINVDNSNFPSTSEPYYAFIVENATVVIDGTGVNVSELGMSLCIGTMDSAELQITGGAQVSTGGVWSTIGSNMATGTLTISGEGSSLTNAQINIGMAVTSLSGGANEEKGDGYYFGRFVQTESHYQGVLAALNSESYQPTDGSYGIVNVKEGGTWTISGSGTSNSRLQLSNGEINIDGEGSSLIFGTNSSLVMQNMTSSLTDAEGKSVTLTVSETLRVTNGGSVKNADDVTLHEAVIGAIYSGSNGEAAIYVSGNASSVDLSVDNSGYGYIGYVSDSKGGSEKVTISATDGGTFKLSTVNSLYIAYVSSSYASSSYSMDISFSAKSGGSVTLDTNGSFFANRNTKDVTTSFTAEDGGSLTISSGSVVYFGYQTKGEGNNIKVTATGEDSTVNVSSGTNMYTSYEANYGDTTFTAENGGSLTLAATGYICLGYGSGIVGSTAVLADGGTVNLTGTQIVTNNNSAANFTVKLTATNGGTMTLTTTSGISFSYNTAVTVEKGSTLTTVGGAYFGSGSSFSVDATSTWTDTGSVTVAAGASMDLAGTETIYDTLDSQGTITVSGGTLDVGSISVTKAGSSGEYDGTFTISGGTVSVETLTIGSDDLGGTFSITSGEIDASSFSIASTASANFSGGIVDVATSIANTGSVTVTNEVVFVLSDALQDENDESGNTYIVIATDTESIETWQNLSSNNFIFADGSTLGRAVVNLDTDGVVTITDQEESATLIWNGTDSLHEWDKNTEDKDWKNGPLDDSFYMGDNVIFNEVASNKDVQINEVLIAGTITVEVSDEAKADDPDTTIEYEFDFSNGASLEGETLTVGEGASLTIEGNGSLTIDGDTDIEGSLAVTDDTTLNAGDITVTGEISVSGDGTVNADSLTLSKDENSGDGASATFSGGETTIDGAVTVDSDSLLTVDGGTLNASEIDVSGDASITGGTVTADTVTVDSDGTLDLDGGTLNTSELTIASDDNADFSRGNLNIGSLTVEDEGGVTFGDGLTVGVYGDDDLDLDLDINLDGSVGFDTSNGDIEIEGTISDNDETTGSLTKTGKGTLTLDGENTYTGGTTIDEGTIDATNTDALGTGEVDIHKGATLKIHSHDSTSENPDEFSNSTTGEGTLELVEGEINLGDVGVQNVVVDKDATLEGDTTLTHSDASLDLAGTLEINVDEGEHITISDSGKVIIEDTATLDLDDDPTFKAGDSFVIVDGGTVTGDIEHFLGTDDSISTAAESFAVIYDTSNGLSVSISKTGEQSVPYMRLHDGLYSDFIAAVITAEDMTLTAGIQGTGDVSSNPIARELLNGNVSRAIEMLNTLAPNDYAAMIAMPTTAFHNDVSSIDKRLAAVRAMPFSEDENARWGYFAQADGTFADNDNANDTPTFDFQLYGVLAGADYRMSNTLTVGVALGYDHEHAKLHNSGGRIDGDDVRVTVYAGAQLTDTVYANVGAQVGYGYYEARRHTVMGRASGETEGYNAGVFADVGMDLPLSEKHGISARPYVGLAYLRSFVSGFDDNLFDIGSFNNDSLRARVGLGVFWDLDGVSLGIDTSFSHDFCGEEIDDMSATYRATGSKFSMMAECLPEDVFSVGPVVSVGISEGLSAFAGYSFQAGSNEYIGHNVYIGVRASF